VRDNNAKDDERQRRILNRVKVDVGTCQTSVARVAEDLVDLNLAERGANGGENRTKTQAPQEHADAAHGIVVPPLGPDPPHVKKHGRDDGAASDRRTRGQDMNVGVALVIEGVRHEKLKYTGRN